MFDIIRYTADKETEWDSFIEHSKNGTFLLKRGYMDYHSYRFSDHSLMFYLKKKLYALLPANLDDCTLYTHQGLTYGGVIMSEQCTTENILNLFCEMNEWLKKRGIHTVVYKAIPHIYSTQPSEEDLYALFRCGAQLKARGISTCIDLHNPLKWRQNRRTALNKAKENYIIVEKSDQLETFWQILENNLAKVHGIQPVHRIDEMRLLKSRFPENIELWVARNSEGSMIAGILLYITKNVIHSQYISATDEGKANGAIDAIIQELLKKDSPYFDFGISTEQNGNYLNSKLIFQKEGFGGRGICYDIYEYTLS